MKIKNSIIQIGFPEHSRYKGFDYVAKGKYFDPVQKEYISCLVGISNDNAVVGYIRPEQEMACGRRLSYRKYIFKK